MGNNTKSITPENMEEWLCSTGFLLPRNELELARFEKLFGKVDESLTGKEIDPDKILKGELRCGNVNVVWMKPTSDVASFDLYKMVARNGGDIPEHILAKMKKNHQRPPANDNGSTKEDNK